MEAEVPVYKMRKGHIELFGDNEPRSYFYIALMTTDSWNVHPIRSEFAVRFMRQSEEKRQEFRDKYVEEFTLTEEVKGIAPAWHFEYGIHKSWRMKEYLERDKMIHNPCIMWVGDNYPQGFVFEGHHRTGAAAALNWKTIPAVILHEEGFAPGYGKMSHADREAMRIGLKERGLPNTSRIQGLKIWFYTELEARQFLIPRPNVPNQFLVRSQDIAECVGEAPEWADIPRGKEFTVKGRVYKFAEQEA